MSRVKLSVCYPYYRHRETIKRHLQEWLSWSYELRSQFDFIIVDDGSPEPLELPLCDLNLRHYRVLEDIPWNYGAKNLAVQQAMTEWLFISELDHVITERAAQLLLQCLRPDTHNDVLTVNRQAASEAADPRYSSKPHPATWLLTRTTFELAGGFDEDFSGRYGHDDTYFVAMLREIGANFQYAPDVVLECHSGNHDLPDADLTGVVGKDPSENTRLLQEKLRDMKRPENRLRFGWNFVGRMVMEPR